jgi:hypothetical protein
MTTITVLQKKLTDGSEVFDLILRQQDGGNIVLACNNLQVGWQMAIDLRNIINYSTNERVHIVDQTLAAEK